MKTFIDIFCGIGGFRLALETRGLKCVFSSEIDKFARQTYQSSFGDEPFGDITKIDAKNIPSHDVLCAGFPCQSFSIAGKKQGMNEARGQLFYEIIRIAKYHQPKVLLLENVPNILRIDGGAVIREIGKLLDDAGYVMQYSILNASYYGIPQARKRVYFVCFRKDLNYSYVRPLETYEQVFLRDYIDFGVTTGFVDKKAEIKAVKQCELRLLKVGQFNSGGQGDRIYSTKGHACTQIGLSGGRGAKTGLYVMDGVDKKYTLTDQRWNCLKAAAERSTGSNLHGFNYKVHTDKDTHTRTLTAIYSNNPKSTLIDQSPNKNPRRLTPRECARVMGFPEDYKIICSDSQAYKQFGNAVIPKMVGLVFDGISKGH